MVAAMAGDIAVAIHPAVLPPEEAAVTRAVEVIPVAAGVIPAVAVEAIPVTTKTREKVEVKK
jgi:hypothetical protein